jgi:AcrR family transcriptional regulator
MSPARRTAEATQELRASLVKVAQRLVAREGASALTMRALAAEAGVAVGLLYKVFGGRGDLVAELIYVEFVQLRTELDQLAADAGTRTVGDNLGRYAELLLSTPTIALAQEIDDEALSKSINAMAGETGVVDALETTVTEYLAAEKRLGRVDQDVDENAFGFLVAGAVHNLLISGDPYPDRSIDDVKQSLAALATRLHPLQPSEETNASH